MFKQYFGYIITALIVSLFFILFIFSIRYEFIAVSIGPIGECYIRSNLLTGESCMVGGGYYCDDFADDFGGIDGCNQ